MPPEAGQSAEIDRIGTLSRREKGTKKTRRGVQRPKTGRDRVRGAHAASMKESYMAATRMKASWASYMARSTHATARAAHMHCK